mmetsp:Transcript_10529/g.24959  ORF Transcript_10529/g.24959 Transcript_10529/m.24959 type:complete len:269 (+) Transcript_10529:823-1629(+)
MALSIICELTTVALGMICRSAWISHSSVTARTTRMPMVRARSPRWLSCHVQAKAKIAAPASAPIQLGMNGMFPPTVLPTRDMLTSAYIMLKSGSRGDRGLYLHGFRAGGNGRGPRGFPRASRGPPRRIPTDAATYLQVGYSLRMRCVRCRTRIRLSPTARLSSPIGVRNQVEMIKNAAQKYPDHWAMSEVPKNDFATKLPDPYPIKPITDCICNFPRFVDQYRVTKSLRAEEVIPLPSRPSRASSFLPRCRLPAPLVSMSSSLAIGNS